MTTLNTIIEEEKEKARKQFDDSPVSLRIDALERYAHVHGWSQFEGRTIQDEIDTIVTTAMQRAYEAGYKLAVEHLKEAYTHNATTTVPEAIEWLEDNSKYQDKK